MKFESIEKFAVSEGYNIEYKPYKYWNNVPHIYGTAMVFDQLGKNYTSILNVESVPSGVFKLDDVLFAVEHGAQSLGIVDKDYHAGDSFYGKRKYMTARQLLENDTPTFFNRDICYYDLQNGDIVVVFGCQYMHSYNKFYQMRQLQEDIQAFLEYPNCDSWDNNELEYLEYLDELEPEWDFDSLFQEYL